LPSRDRNKGVRLNYLCEPDPFILGDCRAKKKPALGGLRSNVLPMLESRTGAHAICVVPGVSDAHAICMVPPTCKSTNLSGITNPGYCCHRLNNITPVALRRKPGMQLILLNKLNR
jgi:hypothetical protein